jgi:hypothetical protein
MPVQIAHALNSTGSRDEEDCSYGNAVNLITKAATAYVGPLLNGVMHGEAVLKFADDTTYEGTICCNKLEGSATVTYAASQYCGELANGMHDGEGVLTVPRSQACYRGMQWHAESSKGVLLWTSSWYG